jgi:hypothetical protein
MGSLTVLHRVNQHSLPIWDFSDAYPPFMSFQHDFSHSRAYLQNSVQSSYAPAGKPREVGALAPRTLNVNSFFHGQLSFLPSTLHMLKTHAGRLVLVMPREHRARDTYALV